MGSFDGMDPTLVRDLLAEVRRAAEQMRTIEARVGQVTRTAGLATPATHRPSQVADACETMARDVTARLALLEKKEAAPRTGEQAKDVSMNGTPASGKDEDPDRDRPTPKDSTEHRPSPKEPRESPHDQRDVAREPREDPKERRDVGREPREDPKERRDVGREPREDPKERRDVGREPR
ncbi:hypothetical protein ACWENQ_27970, partial [Nonomuraea sp. NPDC004354]